MNRSERIAILLLLAALAWPAAAGAEITVCSTCPITGITTVTSNRRFGEPADWELVRLLGTSTSRKWNEPVMLVDVQSIRGGRPVSLAVHNSGWRQQGNTCQRTGWATKPEVPRAISSVLARHKAGDVIAIRVQTIERVAALHSAKVYKAQPGEFASDSAFFAKAETKRSSSGRTRTYVTLVKYGKPTVLALMQDRGKDTKGRTTYTTRGDLAQTVAPLIKGDLVQIDVGPHCRSRVIKHIAKWQEPSVGQFVALGRTDIDGVKHVTVQIRSAKGTSEPMLVQQKSLDGVRYIDDYAMTRFVKTLQADQPVFYKTRTQGGRTILWLIGRLDKTTRTARGDTGSK